MPVSAKKELNSDIDELLSKYKVNYRVGIDPDSIDFFHRMGLDYVSCSPYRVPVARLAAAQAAISSEERDSHRKLLKTSSSRRSKRR